jgi:hypothetical protein
MLIAFVLATCTIDDQGELKTTNKFDQLQSFEVN